MTNLDYFECAVRSPEPLLDPFYAKNKLVLPPAGQENELTRAHARLLELIDRFQAADRPGADEEEPGRIADRVAAILDGTANINYSPFCQFFMVYNTTYSEYRQLRAAEKRPFLLEMLRRYCAERHGLYGGLGYSGAMLQMMCDNYSHKRNARTGIDKFLSLTGGRLHPQGTLFYLDTDDDYYFLPDKGDGQLFESFLAHYGLRMRSRETEQGKLPDVVFRHAGEFYICELKTMKGFGGGQNKQIVEVVNFIRYGEADARFHYLVFLDGPYANTLLHDDSPKVTSQREDILAALHANPGNYFLNTAALRRFFAELFA